MIPYGQKFSKVKKSKKLSKLIIRTFNFRKTITFIIRKFIFSKMATDISVISMVRSDCINYVVREHHIYKDIWTPVIGEELTCRKEFGNIHDLHAVAVIATWWQPGRSCTTYNIDALQCFYQKRGSDTLCHHGSQAVFFGFREKRSRCSVQVQAGSKAARMQ